MYVAKNPIEMKYELIIVFKFIIIVKLIANKPFRFYFEEKKILD